MLKRSDASPFSGDLKPSHSVSSSFPINFVPLLLTSNNESPLEPTVKILPFGFGIASYGHYFLHYILSRYHSPTLHCSFPVLAPLTTSTSEISSRPKKPSASSNLPGSETSFQGNASRVVVSFGPFSCPESLSLESALCLFRGFWLMLSSDRFPDIGAIKTEYTCRVYEFWRKSMHAKHCA